MAKLLAAPSTTAPIAAPVTVSIDPEIDVQLAPSVPVTPVTQPETETELRNELARLKMENVRLKAAKKKGTSLRVSEKGGVSLYGVRRFPITFYNDEWDTILDMADDIRAFKKAHKAELKSKPVNE